MIDKGANSLDNRTNKAHPKPSPAIIDNNTGADGRETGRAPACNPEERDMWTILFSLASAAALGFGVAAIVLAYNTYLARVARSGG